MGSQQGKRRRGLATSSRLDEHHGPPGSRRHCFELRVLPLGGVVASISAARLT